MTTISTVVYSNFSNRNVDKQMHRTTVSGQIPSVL